MNDLHRLLIDWRCARATFAEAVAKDPEVFNEPTQTAADAVDETTGALLEWIDRYLPGWRSIPQPCRERMTEEPT